MYKSFDYNPPKDVRGIFLELSKAFVRVWPYGLIYKINRIGITGNSLKLIESFLSSRFQRVILNGKSSSWTPVYAGVPEGSILGPLFFLIYINDLSQDIFSTVKLFADDTSIFSVVDDVNGSVMQLNNDLLQISTWAIRGKCLSILMFPNKPKRFSFFAKATNLLILLQCLIKFQLKNFPFRNI